MRFDWRLICVSVIIAVLGFSTGYAATLLPVFQGGTGTGTFTAYSVVCGGTTTTGALQNVSGLGNANQVLTSNGAGALPSWEDAGAAASDHKVSVSANDSTPNYLLSKLAEGTGIDITEVNDAGDEDAQIAVDEDAVDHNALGNLTTGDAHAQYFNIYGRSGGQVAYGGTASGDGLLLRSTSNATQGVVSVGVRGAPGYFPVLTVRDSASSVNTLFDFSSDGIATFHGGPLVLADIAAPSSAGGFSQFYSKAGVPYAMDDAGNEYDLTAAGGTGMQSFFFAGDDDSTEIEDGDTATVAGDSTYIRTTNTAGTVVVSHGTTGVVGAYTYPTMMGLDDAGHVTSISGGSAPVSHLHLAGSSGSTEQLDDGDTITIAAGNMTSTTGAATDTVTVAYTGWTTKYKTADETIQSDNTLTRDNTLYFPMLANKKYTFRMIVYLYESSSGDFKYRHVGPASPTVVAVRRKHIIGGGTSDVVGYDTAYSAADVTMLTTSSGIGYMEWRGIVHNGANAGDFEFQWAQNSSAAYDTTVYAGSFIEYKQVD